MRHKEEIELTVLHFGLLDEACVDVRTLGWVLDEFVALLRLALLEEPLTDALVNDDQRDLRGLVFELWHRLLFLTFCLSLCQPLLLGELGVFFGHDLVELVQLLVDDHLSHTIADTISVDEDVFGHGAIEVAVALESALEVIG